MSVCPTDSTPGQLCGVLPSCGTVARVSVCERTDSREARRSRFLSPPCEVVLRDQVPRRSAAQWAAADAVGCERCLTRWMRLRTAFRKSKRSLPHLDVRHDWSFSNHQRLICLSVPQRPRSRQCPQSTHQTTPPPSPLPRPRVEPGLACSCAAAAPHSACWARCCWHCSPLQQLLTSEQLELGPIR